MTVGGLCEEFASGILDGYESLCRGRVVPADPAQPFAGRIIDSLIRGRKQFAVIWEQVPEGAGAAAAVARYPGKTAACGILYGVSGRVDPYQFITQGYQLRHDNNICLCKDKKKKDVQVFLKFFIFV